MIKTCPYWRIGLTEAALMKNYFQFFKIPEPTTSQFKTFSGTFAQSDGGQAQMGYYNLRMTWQALRPDQAFFIRVFIDAALGASASGTGVIYLTVPYNNADKMSLRWIDIAGIPYPLDASVGGTINGGLGMYYENVELFVNNITIINDPAII